MLAHSWLQRWASHSFTSAGGGQQGTLRPSSPPCRSRHAQGHQEGGGCGGERQASPTHLVPSWLAW